VERDKAGLRTPDPIFALDLMGLRARVELLISAPAGSLKGLSSRWPAWGGKRTLPDVGLEAVGPSTTNDGAWVRSLSSDWSFKAKELVTGGIIGVEGPATSLFGLMESFRRVGLAIGVSKGDNG
jgi:hypothetical protein